jgi:hypothetical protein
MVSSKVGSKVRHKAASLAVFDLRSGPLHFQRPPKFPPDYHPPSLLLVASFKDQLRLTL